MTEKNMQSELLVFLEKKFKKAKIYSEYPFIHGTADVLMKYKGYIYIFELKTQPNSRLFEQCLKHKKIGDFIIAIALLPKKNETIIEWENRAYSNNISLLWMDNLKKKLIKKLIKNQEVNKKLRRLTYGI